MRYDVCIAGSGVVGSALAAALAPLGLRIALVDRSFREQDRIVGELLQPEGVDRLGALGLADILDDLAARPVHGYALFRDGRSITLDYPGDGMTGYGLRNGRFVQRLRERAWAHTAVEPIEATVTDLLWDGDRVTGVETSAGRILARWTIASDGFHSRLRTDLHARRPQRTGHFAGYLIDDRDLIEPGHGHLVQSDDRPVLAYPVPGNQARVLIGLGELPGSVRSRAFRHHIEHVVAPSLPEPLHEAVACAARDQTARVMPTQFLPARTRQRPRGVVLVGDALNMRHPLTGSGMTVGLGDAVLVRDALRDGSDDPEAAIDRAFARRNDANASINILADALAQVMEHPRLSAAVFDYLGRGGRCADEPMEILAGRDQRRTTLLRHFIAVAGVGAMQNDLPWTDRLQHAVVTVLDAGRILWRAAR